MQLHSFDLNLLCTFDAIYRSQSISAAAIELGLTQPGVSSALKRLRERVGDPLFVRTSRGMRSTPFAENMAPKVFQALKLLSGIDQPVTFAPATSTVDFKIYISDAGLHIVIPQVVERMNTQAPHASLTVVDLRPDEVTAALDSGSIDMAAGFFLDMPNWARQQVVRATSYVCAVRKNHPRIRDALTLDQFLAERHCAYWTSGSSHSKVEQTLSRQNLVRDVAFSSPSFTSMLLLASQSDMIATVPEDLAFTYSRMLDIRLHPSPVAFPRFEIRQYWHERQHAAPASKWLRRLFRGAAADLPRGGG